MGGNKSDTAETWVDPDDAPEVTDADITRGSWHIGDREIPAEEGRAAFAKLLRGRPPKDGPLKVRTTIRFDADVIAALKATGKGWQTRVNAAMRKYLESGQF